MSNRVEVRRVYPVYFHPGPKSVQEPEAFKWHLHVLQSAVIEFLRNGLDLYSPKMCPIDLSTIVKTIRAVFKDIKITIILVQINIISQIL